MWSPWKHEKYDQRSSAAGQRNNESEAMKTRLGPQNPGNWIRGCDPKMQDSKQPDPNSFTNGNKITTSELSAPPNLRVRDAQEKRTVGPRTTNTMHGDWRTSDKNRPDVRNESGGRFSNLEYDSRSRGSQRTLSFNNNSKHMDRNFGSNSHSHRNSSYEEAPEWMTEPTSKFEMMSLGGFDDDRRGIPDEEIADQKAAANPQSSSQSAPNERSITPDFERMMKDMLNLTEDENVTEIPVTQTTEPQRTGSKSSKWFGNASPPDRRPDVPLSFPSAGHQMTCGPNDRAQNDLMQILQRANISLHHLQPHANLPPKPVHVKSLDEIEHGLRTESGPGPEDKQAFNKLLDLLSRRGSGHQPAAQQTFAPMTGDLPVRVSRPSSYEIEEMNRQRKVLEAQHVEQQQQKNRTQFPPAFSMVPIQVMRNATATDRRGLLPNETEAGVQPRAITGSAQSHAQQRPVRQPVSPFGQDFEMQRQVMFQQEMMQRQRTSGNFGPRLHQPRPLMPQTPDLAVGQLAGSRPALSAQQMHQLQQLQMMNQQLHQLNPSQLQQTRGMSAAQIQQFLMRAAPAQHS